MKNKASWIIASFILIAALLAAWFALKSKAQTDTIADPAAGADSPGSGSAYGSETPVPKNDGMPLKQGSSGPLVKDIQNAVNDNYGANLVPDGIWGNYTQKALKSRGLPTVIYWKQYQEITGKDISVTSGTIKDAATPAWVPWPFGYLWN